MAREIRFQGDIEKLWLMPPESIPADSVLRLQMEIGNLHGRMLGVPPQIIRATRYGAVGPALLLSNHLRTNVEALPNGARRVSLAALALLPAAYGRSHVACRGIAALFDITATGPADLALIETLGQSWSETLIALAESWRRWGGLSSEPAATLDPAAHQHDAPPDALDDGEPTREEILSSIDRIIRSDDAKPLGEAEYKATMGDEPKKTVAPVTYVQVLKQAPPPSEAPMAVNFRRYTGLARPLPVAAPSNLDAFDRLDTLFPSFADVTQGLRRELWLAVGVGAARVKLAPRLLIGPPGSGKSRYLQALGGALERPVRFLPAAANDSRGLTGTARGYSTAMPSFPATVFADTLRADPVIVLDEIDKADTRDGRCALQSALLAMIEPSTASAWHDDCLMVDCDLTWIGWMLTANTAEGILPALLDRCRVHRIGQPSPGAFDAYVSTILADIALELGAPVEALPPLDLEVRTALRAAFRRNPSLRDLKRALRNVLAIAPYATRH